MGIEMNGIPVGRIHTSILDPIVTQTIGNSEVHVMSQKAVSLEFDKRAELIKNVLNPDDPDIEIGGYYQNDLSWVQDNGFFESGYIPCKAGDCFRWQNATDKYGGNVMLYNANKEFIDKMGWATHTAAYFTIPNNENIAYFRIPQLTRDRYTTALYNTDKLIRSFVPYGHPFNYGDYLASRGFARAEFIENVLNPDDPDIEIGGYYHDNHVWEEAANFMQSGYIPCKAGDCFIEQGLTSTYGAYVMLYNANKEYLMHIPYYTHTAPYFTIPNDDRIAYCRIPMETNHRYTLAFYNTDKLIKIFVPYGHPFNYGDYLALRGFVDNQNVGCGEQWNGKTWYAYGTSMTSIAQGKYVPVVQELSGMTVVNKGIPGGCLTPDGFGKGNVKTALMNTTDGKLNADLITIDVLPNEGATVGDIYNTDNTSFCGCLNQCLRYLQENTTAQIVIIIMIGSNDSTPDNIETSRGITQYEFSRKIKQVAELNSVPVIDIIGESGFGYGRVKNKAYQVDSIHLNDIGGKNMGYFVWSKLKNIPLWYSELPS